MAENSLSPPVSVPVMALPGALLFPHALLPLYIFEPRYRAMLAHCLADQRMFCVALVKPGVSEATCPDDIFPVAGCGLVRACVGNPGGTSTLILQGLWRVRLTRFTQETPFPIAEIAELPSEQGDTVQAEALGAKVLELCRQLKERGQESSIQLEASLAHLTNLDILADLVAHTFVANPFQRQTLLAELAVPARLRLLIQYLSAALAE